MDPGDLVVGQQYIRLAGASERQGGSAGQSDFLPLTLGINIIEEHNYSLSGGR